MASTDVQPDTTECPHKLQAWHFHPDEYSYVRRCEWCWKVLETVTHEMLDSMSEEEFKACQERIMKAVPTLVEGDIL